jgi:hypothetical protein
MPCHARVDGSSEADTKLLLTVWTDRRFRRATDTVKNTVNFLRLLRSYSGASLETYRVIQWLVVRSRSLMIETTSSITAGNYLI